MILETNANRNQIETFKHNLVRAVLIGKDLEEVDLSEGTLREANFSRAFLNRANFRKADLTGADFHAASLTNSQFVRAYLINVNFIGANLRNSDLRGADLMGAKLTAANLKGANLKFAENLTHIQVQEAILDRSTLIPEYLEVSWIDDDRFVCRQLVRSTYY
ncbi:MAG: hypothetical protein COV67_14490 [Nitrospinae bacterium CG11_big_fil_rev_8_21_14_0_20_56_8]|nr:MAG: hypothetical protein COV67_14490 [Nitrospinae bacterium CG11_big_fil_rev_8_21_14_0_20_56_8]